MTYGLRILNDDSELLIDSEFVNPTFVQKLEFNTTPTFTEAGPSWSQVHPNFIRRDYSTSSVILGTGEYIVLWALPDTMVPGQPEKDVWYVFPTSVATGTIYFSCSVYANSSGSPISYSLPTAYIFTTTAAGVNSLSSTGYGLRMYNSSNVKTFDSNFTQLVPYSITDNFTMPTSESTTSLYLATPTNPIYLLPKTAVLFAGDQTNSGVTQTYYKTFDVAFKRRGSYIDSRTMSTEYIVEPDAPINTNFVSFFAGSFSNLSVIVADADLYQAPAGGTQTGANPTYTLSSNATAGSINEGTALTVTLTTTLLANNTNVPWTVTGISTADLVSGSLTGNFVIQNNTATATFNIKNDTSTESLETFLLTLDYIGTSISINIQDTSVATTYSWATPGSINENTTGSLVFNYAGAPSKTITFSIVPPLMGTAATSADVTLNTTTYTTTASNAAGTVTVSYSTANDSLTEGDEAFAIQATVDGNTYTSADITINDTSKSPSYNITVVNGPWNENTTQSTTVALDNVNGYIYYPTSNSSAVTCQTANFTVSGNSYTTTLYWTVGAVSADTTVTLYLRRGSATGTIDAQTTVVVKDIPAAGTAIGSAYCLAYGTSPYTLRQVYANGSGGTYNSDTNNSPTCGYVTPTYTLTASPTTVDEGSSFTITLTTNQSGSFPYTITGVSSTDIGGTSLTGTLANGGTRVINVSADTATEGTEYFVVSLDNGLASVPVTINDTSTATLVISQSGSTYGTVGTAFSANFTLTVNGNSTPASWSSSGTLPAGLSLTQNGGSAGSGYQTYTLSGTPTTVASYTFTVIATPSSGGSTSKSVTIPIYNAAGTNSGSTYCGTGANQYTLYQNKHDGSGSTYPQVVETNSSSCGYVAPSFTLSNTTTGTLSNGGGFTFIHNAYNANGTAISFSVTGAGSSYVTLSPSTFTVSGSSESRNISVTTTARPPGTPSQSVTITPNYAPGFSFSLANVPAGAPTVVSTSRQTPYNTNVGDQARATISWSSGITSTTYMQIEITLGLYAPYYNNGNPLINNYAGGFNSAGDAQMLIGATDAVYYLPQNPGNFNTVVSIRARSVAADGITGTSSWTTPLTFYYVKQGGVAN